MVGRQGEAGKSPGGGSSSETPSPATSGKVTSRASPAGGRADGDGIVHMSCGAQDHFPNVMNGRTGSACRPRHSHLEKSVAADASSQAELPRGAFNPRSVSGGASKIGRQRTRRRSKKDKAETRSEGREHGSAAATVDEKNEQTDSDPTGEVQRPASSRDGPSSHEEAGPSGKTDFLSEASTVRVREEKEAGGHIRAGARPKASTCHAETVTEFGDKNKRVAATASAEEERKGAKTVLLHGKAVESSLGHSEAPVIRVLREAGVSAATQTGGRGDSEADGDAQPSSSGEVDPRATDLDESDGDRPPASSSERRDSGDSVAGPPVRLVRAYSQYYKTKMCAYVVQGRACARDSKCVYAHSESELREPPNLEKTRLCPVFKQTGACPNKDSCAYAHSAVELRHTVTVFKTKICHMWNKGKCGAGPACRHAHGLEELKRHRQRSQQELVALSRGSQLQVNLNGAAGLQRSCQQSEEGASPVNGGKGNASSSTGESGDAHKTKEASGKRAKEDENTEAESKWDGAAPSGPSATAKGLAEKKPQASDRAALTRERRVPVTRRPAAGTEGAGQHVRAVAPGPEQSFGVSGPQRKGRAEDRKAQVALAALGMSSSQRVRDGFSQSHSHTRVQPSRQHGDSLRGYVSDREITAYRSSRDLGLVAPHNGRARDASGAAGADPFDSSGRERDAVESRGGQPTLNPLAQVLASDLRLPWIQPPPERSRPPMQRPEQVTRQVPACVPWSVSGGGNDGWRDTAEQVPAALTQYLSALLALQNADFSSQEGQNLLSVSEPYAVSGMRGRVPSMSHNQTVAPVSRTGSGGAQFQLSASRGLQQRPSNFGDPLESVSRNVQGLPSSVAQQRRAQQGALLQLLLGCRAGDFAGGSTQRMASVDESPTERLHHGPLYRETPTPRTARGFSESRSPRTWTPVPTAAGLDSVHLSSALASGRTTRTSSVPSFAVSSSTAVGLLELLARPEPGGSVQSALEPRSQDSGASFPLADGGFLGLATDGAAAVLDAASARDDGGEHAGTSPRRLLLMKGDSHLQDSVQYFLSTVAPMSSGRTTPGSSLQENPLQAPLPAEVAPGSQQGLPAMPPSTTAPTDGRFCRGSAPPVGAYFPQPASVGGRRPVPEPSTLPTVVASVPFTALPEGSGESRTDTPETPWVGKGNWC